MRQIGGEVVSDSVGEVALTGRCVDGMKGQHDERQPRRDGVRRETEPVCPPAEAGKQRQNGEQRPPSAWRRTQGRHLRCREGDRRWRLEQLGTGGRPWGGGVVLRVHPADEAVADGGDGGDERRPRVGGAERTAQSGDLHREVVLLDDEPVPHLAQQFVLGDGAVPMFDQQQQNIQRARTQHDGRAVGAERAAIGLQCEAAESIAGGGERR
jgi:hypothetical protein